MSAWNGAGSSWQYSRWVKNMARNARQVGLLPGGMDRWLNQLLVAAFYEPISQTGWRPWLRDAFLRKATAAGANYECDLSLEPDSVIIELVEVIGRDLKKIPIRDDEKAWVDAVIAFQENVMAVNRRYGTTPYYGSVGGSTVGVP